MFEFETQFIVAPELISAKLLMHLDLTRAQKDFTTSD